MSGTPVFAGTRVPVRTLLDYIEGGESLDDFLEQFPTVSRQRAIAFLEQASRTSAHHGLMRLLLDECLPRETTVSKRWIPERLGMGSVSNVTFCLRSQKKA